MYEELSPLPINKGLYDGLAGLLGQFFALNQLHSQNPLFATELQVALVQDVVELLLLDNPRCNVARFHKGISAAAQLACKRS